MVLCFGGIYGCKVVRIEEDTDVEVGVDVGVSETDTREGGRNDGVDRWAVKGVFRAMYVCLVLATSFYEDNSQVYR